LDSINRVTINSYLMLTVSMRYTSTLLLINVHSYTTISVPQIHLLLQYNGDDSLLFKCLVSQVSTLHILQITYCNLMGECEMVRSAILLNTT